MTDHSRKEAATAHLDRSERALRSARILLREDEALDAVSRAYYAALHAARAALTCVGEAPKSHRGTHDLFWRHFVESGRLPRSLSSFLSNARDMRANADYDAFTRFDTAAATDFTDDAEAFVTATASLVQELIEDLPGSAADVSK